MQEESPQHTPDTPSTEEQLKVWGRKERPLPKRGCSIAFFVFLALLILFILVQYIKYHNQ